MDEVAYFMISQKKGGNRDSREEGNVQLIKSGAQKPPRNEKSFSSFSISFFTIPRCPLTSSLIQVEPSRLNLSADSSFLESM